MHEYDTALKRVLTRLSGRAMAAMTGFEISRWHNVELPQVRSTRVDMLGETADEQLVHIELQSSNDSRMALRMAEYALAILREYGRLPHQILLYAGADEPNMPVRLSGEFFFFEYKLVDMRTLDGDTLLSSEIVEENILALLMRLKDKREAVRQILSRIAEGAPEDRAPLLAELTVLAGLRKLGAIIKEETKGMPLLDDIMDHDLFGPAIRQGREEGIQEGMQRGMQQGQRELLLQVLSSRFGSVPAWAQAKLSHASAAELQQLASRIFTAETLEDLLQ